MACPTPVLPLRRHLMAEYAAAPLLATFNLLVNSFSDYPEIGPACAAQKLNRCRTRFSDPIQVTEKTL